MFLLFALVFLKVVVQLPKSLFRSHPGRSSSFVGQAGVVDSTSDPVERILAEILWPRFARLRY